MCRFVNIVKIFSKNNNLLYKRGLFATVLMKSVLDSVFFFLIWRPWPVVFKTVFYLILPSELESNRMKLFAFISWLLLTKSWFHVTVSDRRHNSSVLQSYTCLVNLPNLLIQVFNNWILLKIQPWARLVFTLIFNNLNLWY